MQRTRLVLNFPGFETTSAIHQIERLTAGAEKTAALWNFDVAREALEDDPDNHKTIAGFEAKGKEWATNTRYVQLSWSDIIEGYESLPYPKSLFKHFPDYLRFFLDGTVGKYRRVSGRYFGFTIYPLVYMLLCCLLALIVAISLGVNGLIALVLPALAVLVLTRFPGDRLYVNLSINDWAFARDLALQKNPDIEQRFDVFAEHIIDEIKASGADEILIVGHSFGSVWAIEALARALGKNPDLLKGKRATFLALGSSLMKIGLVKQAGFIRQSAQTVLGVENLTWHEVQTKTDFISFYKSDPFAPMGIDEHEAQVVTHRVNFKHALSKQRHRKMMKSMYLAHRQYILYCDKRVHHDFQLRVFGPFFADELARDAKLAIESDLVS